MPENLLDLLKEAAGMYISGEEMSKALGVTRAAVWKQVERLRQQGYVIQAATNQGYRLVSCPEVLDRERILSLGEHPWKNRITVLETVDSTNSLAKRQALQGAPHGTVYVSDEQTGGRGRQGRSFISPRGKGLYLSVLLRPACAPAEVAHVTAMAGVAACDAVEAAAGVRPGIKWTNDLLLGEKKLAGILSELSVEWESSTLEYLVIGIGINCAQLPGDFPEELREKAGSLLSETGSKPDRDLLAAALIRRLGDLSRELLTGKAQWLQQYARDCVTIGRKVRILRQGRERLGTATGIDENGALIVRYETGETGVVFSGEVSVRGENGYI